MHKVFDIKRKKGNNESGTFRCQASESLSLFPILAYWAKTEGFVRFADKCLPELIAFIALCEVLEILANMARAMRVDGIAALLQQRVEIFLRRFRLAWDEDLKPKHHWMLHYAQRMRKFGMLQSCFVTERKHKLVRRYANDVQNMPAFETATISELCCHMVANLKEPEPFSFKVGLRKPRACPKKLHKLVCRTLDLGADEDIKCSSVCQYSELGTCSIGDMVFVREGRSYVACKVFAHVLLESSGLVVTMGYPGNLHRQDAHGAAFWTMGEDLDVFDSEDIITDVIWRPCADGTICTLIPPFF